MSPTASPGVTQVAAMVPTQVAEDLRSLAEQRERSVAAELRLAIRAWLDGSKREAA